MCIYTVYGMSLDLEYIYIYIYIYVYVYIYIYMHVMYYVHSDCIGSTLWDINQVSQINLEVLGLLQHV